MKLLLVISIFLNLVLLGFLVELLANRPHEKIAAAPATQSKTASVTQPLPVAAPQFQWNQLESTNDYRAYIANLRVVGCPEATIRAIVTADTEAAFSLKREQLELTETDHFSPERAKQIAANLLSKPADTTTSPLISTEEAALETQISSAPVFSSQPSSANGVRSAQQAVATLASYPVTLQEPVANDSSLNSNQKAAVRQIQQQFEDAIGGPNQNPSDPAYAARWQTAQQDADDALRAALGNQAYQGYKLQHYYSNFQKVILNAGDGPVMIDPTALAK